MKKYSLLVLTLLSLNSPLFAQKFQGKKADIQAILKNIQDFSQHYINAEYEELAECYTLDGKIFPDKSMIIEGRSAIQKRWTLAEGVRILAHTISPIEIKVLGQEAYDYGYYEGRTQRADGTEVSWKGKYVIIWKKIKGQWKIYLDIWNRI